MIKVRSFFYIASTLCFLSILSSCSDKIDKEDMYTFKGQTIADYIRNTPELSMFAQIMEKSQAYEKSSTTVSALLNVIGDKTVFVPTNEAITLFLDSIYGPQQYMLDTISNTVIDQITHNCIIPEDAKITTKLKEGVMVENTLNAHHLIVELGDFGDGRTIRINRNARVLIADVKCTNGLVHVVDQVIRPAPNTLSGLIAEIDNLRIFNHLLEETGWADSLLLFRDYDYEAFCRVMEADYQKKYPTFRVYGYMALVETDSVFYAKWGVPMPKLNKETEAVENWSDIMYSIQQNCQATYPQATSPNLKSSNNAINQFVSYHLLPFKTSLEHLVTHQNEYMYNYIDYQSLGYEKGVPYTVNVWQYYQTMGRLNRVLKITQTAKDGKMHINRHSYYNNACDGDYQETSCDYEGVTILPTEDGLMNEAANGCYYTLDDILVYDEYVQNTVLNERMRYSFASMQPELFSNGYRGLATRRQLKVDCTFPTQYFQNLTASSDVRYLNICQGVYPYNEEFIMSMNYGKDVIFKLLPVPFSGKWEIRIAGMSQWGNENSVTHGKFKIFFGETPDLVKMTLINPTASFSIFNKFNTKEGTTYDAANFFWESDAYLLQDSTLMREYDKRLYVMGWKKGPKYFMHGTSRSKRAITFRDYSQNLRLVIGRPYLEAGKNYYLRLQVINKISFNTDWTFYYIEAVPPSVYNAFDGREEDIW